MKQCNRSERFLNFVLAVSFVCLISFYFVKNSVWLPFHDEFPVVVLQNSSYKEIDGKLKRWITSVERGYEETFYTRMEKVEDYGRWNQRLGKKILDDADPDRSVIRGEGDMLYYAIPKPVDTKEFTASFFRLDRFLKERRIYFAYVQAPYKHLKNSTAFPKGVIDYGNRIADEFSDSLKKEGIDVLDLNFVFEREGKKEEQVFFKTDTHWKIPFAFYGYQKTAEFLKENEVELTDFDVTTRRESYTVKKWKGVYIGSHGKRTGDVYAIRDDLELLIPNFDTDLEYLKYTREGKLMKERKGSFEDSFLFYGYLNSEDKYQDKYVVYMDWGASEDVILNRRVKNGKKLLIVKDSFAMPMAGFLSLNFEKTVLLDIREENRPQSIEEYIEKEHFDTVLFIASPTSMYYSPEMFLMPLH